MSTYKLIGWLSLQTGFMLPSASVSLFTHSLQIPAYTLIGTYQNPSAGLQKLMEIGTIIGDKAYSEQYIADAPRFTGYLSTVQKMIDSLVIKKSLGTGIGPMLDNSTNLYLQTTWKVL